jgi:hypothetical protein
MALLHGHERTATGALDTTEKAGAISTGQIHGWAHVNGSPYIVTDGAFEATDVKLGGHVFTVDGALYVSTAAAQKVVGGIAKRTDDMVCITVGAPASTARYVFDPILGTLLVSAAGLVHTA